MTMTHDAVRELLGAPMRSPSHLCAYLEMRPSLDQTALMERATTLRDPDWVLDTSETAADRIFQAAAVWALWRTLLLTGSRTTILAPAESRRVDFMATLHRICTHTAPGLNAITRFPRWNRLQIGLAAGWDLRAVANSHFLVAERARTTFTAVILGAGSSDPEFLEARKTLEEGMVGPKRALVRLW